MKKLLICTLFISSCSWLGEPSNRTPASQEFNHSNDYCISIRGNGQRMAALWGAITKIVESYGEPAGMSGGSSATYSMFLTESILMNPYYSDQKGTKERREQQTLLLKSLMGYIDYLLATPLFEKALKLADDPKTMDEINRLMSQMNSSNSNGLKKLFGTLKLAFRYVSSSRVRKIAYIFGHDDTKMLMNQELFGEFLGATQETQELEELLARDDISDEDKKEAIKSHQQLLAYRKDEFNKAISYFGNYNIKENANIFLRPGPLNFLGFAKVFNRAANFYAGRGHTVKIAKKFEEFLDRCAPNSLGKQWSEIAAKGSRCEKDFNNLVKLHTKEQLASEEGFKKEYYSVPGRRIRRSKKVPFEFDQRINDEISNHLLTIPTTGLLIGDSAKEMKEHILEYKKQIDPHYGLNLHANSKDIRIGYWGDESTLQYIEKRLNKEFTDTLGRRFNFSDDYKSSLFYPLYKAKWNEVFITSPVEPSLSSIQNMPRVDEVVSIGGWMDHLSAPVLKAAGCPRVVTITKGDGLGKFATGMIKRVLGPKNPTWDAIPDLVINGDANDTNSIWGRYFNIANPKASFNTGLNSADAVVCANYDLLQLSDGMPAFFDNGYNAPIAFHPKISDSFLKQHKFAKEITMGDRNNQDPPYISCFPLEYR